MKSALPRLAVLAGLWTALSVNFALGQTIRFRSSEASATADNSTVAVAGDTASPFVPETQAATAAPTGNCARLRLRLRQELRMLLRQELRLRLPHGCDDCPGYGLEVFSGVEAYHNVTDYFYQRDAGFVVGGNVGAPVPKLSEYGIGAQFGVGYHAADFDGRFLYNSFNTTETSATQQELFLTAGLFRRACGGDGLLSHFSMGIAYDWLLTTDFGAIEQSPTLGQWRGQVGYCLSDCNEIGVWGTLRDRGSCKDGHLEINDPDFNQFPYHYQALSQIDFFWHHTFCCGANMWLNFGIPEQTYLAVASDGSQISNGSLYSWTLGATFIVPISKTLALYADGEYMRPSCSASAGGPYAGLASIEQGYSICFGLQFYPSGNAGTNTVAGNCWMPLLPVANNSNFLINSNVQSH